jgi:hypothetical protein
MRPGRVFAALAALALTSGCAGGGVGSGLFHYYSLVTPGPEDVAHHSMIVTPTLRWNKAPRGPYDIDREENWTLNGPLLDGLTFIRADMNPAEIASMIESFYRIRAGSTRFDMTGLQPRPFLGHEGFQFDFAHLGGDEVERKGRAVGAIIEGRFYLALFDATRMHYFDAGLPEFERIVESARLAG